MNAVDGCYETWKYTAVYLAEPHDGFGSLPVDTLPFKAAEKLSITELSK